MKTLKKLLRVFVILIFMTNELCAQSIVAVSNNCAGATVQPISADGAGQSSGTTFGSNLELGESIACAPAGTNQSVWWSFITPSAGSLVPLVVNVVENPPNASPCSGASYSCCPITTVVWESIAGGCPMTDPCKMVSCQSSTNGPQTPFGGGGNPALTRRHRHQLGLNELLPNTKYYVQVLYSTSCSQRALFNYWVSNSAVYVDITNRTAVNTCSIPGSPICNIVTPIAPNGATIVANCAVIGDPPEDTINTVVRDCHSFNTNGNTSISFSNYIGSNCTGLDDNWDTTKNVTWGYWRLSDMSCNVISCGYIGNQSIISVGGLSCYTDYKIHYQYEIRNCTHSTHTFYTFGPNDVCVPLPVELVDFNAVLNKDKHVSLSWRTLSENNNLKFVIERSSNGLDFSSIMTVPGQGNSTTGMSYQTLDKNPFFGLNYYRLKQVDYNGNYNYSAIRVVDVDHEKMVSIYPNPAKDLIFIDSKELLKIEFVDVLGQGKMSLDVLVGNNSIDVSHLCRGMYLLRIIYPNGTNQILKIVLQ